MPLTLFDDKPRTRTTPKKPGESEFAFYDTSARTPYVVYRALINSWLAEVSDVQQAELFARFTEGSGAQYYAALAELVIHAALRRCGFNVEVHPQCPHPTRRPDFLVKDQAGNQLAFVEVTTFGPEIERTKRDNREAAIYNALDTVDLPPGWLLGYSVERHGTTSPSLKSLKRNVERWATEVCGDDPTVMPQRVFPAGDWQIELRLHGGYRTDKAYERRIAAAMIGVRELSPHLDLRQALEIKGQRYGIVDTPYLIVVADCKDAIPSGEDVADALLDALFGAPGVSIRRFADGRTEEAVTRARDGYWGHVGAQRNRNVSAVVLFPEPSLWKLRDRRWQPLIAHNPFALRPLPRDVLSLPGYAYLEEADELRWREGTILADILQLPAKWPPDE